MLRARGVVLYRGLPLRREEDLPSDAQILRDYKMPPDTPVPAAGGVGAQPVPVPQGPSGVGTILHTDLYHPLPDPVPTLYAVTYAPQGYVSMYHNGLRVRPDLYAADAVTRRVVVTPELAGRLRPGDELQIVYNRIVGAA